MFDIGFQELVMIFIVAILIIGPKKLPEFGKTLGKWIVEIKKGINSVKADVETEIHEANKKLNEDVAESISKEEKTNEKNDVNTDKGDKA